jgi:hypothetical protein
MSVIRGSALVEVTGSENALAYFDTSVKGFIEQGPGLNYKH